MDETAEELSQEEPPAATTSGSYISLGRIARGGMGEVELAYRRQGRFRRLYAVKRMHPHLVDDLDARQMFLEEARIAGLLSHPNVIAVNDVGEDERGPFLVMDYLDGLSLSAVVHFARKSEQQIPIQVVVRIVMAIAKGLHAAHTLRDHRGNSLELVHRDVSPSNVLMSWEGGVRITDFGVARALGRSLKTSTGVLKGKLPYMSPEQLKFRKLDHRSDLFSLGVLLYELLTIERLYQNDADNEGIRRILEESPPDVGEVRAGVPPSLVALVFALLAKDPADRPVDAGEVARRLESVLAEVLVGEPALDLGAWLTGLAGEFREERRSVLERTLDEAEERMLAPLLTVASAGSDAITPRRSRNFGPWGWGAVAASVITLVAGSSLVWMSQHEPGESVVDQTPSTTDEEHLVDAPPAKQAVGIDSTPDTDPETVAADGDGALEEQPAMLRAARRRGRRHMRAPPTVMEEAAGPLQLRPSWDESGR